MWDDVVRDAVTLFVVIDPIGSLPLFLAVTRGRAPAQRRRIALRGILIAGIILIGFIVMGQVLLKAMDIRLASFQVAGGIVLFVFGLKMIFETTSDQGASPEEGHDVAVFPLAVPSIASPGAMLAVVVLTDNDRHSITEQVGTTTVLVVILAITYVVLLLAGLIHRYIGDTGASIVSRVMGLILSAVAVEMIITGLTAFGVLSPFPG